MKTLPIILFAIFLLTACSKSGEHSSHEQQDGLLVGDSPNEALYNQVMEIHDEVMPRMEDLYTLKKDLQNQIANTPDMVVERKQQLEKVISNLDSANSAMMDWMHKFNPLPDSVDQEQAREYLESEMERIRKVRDLMTETIENAEAEVKNK
jgi:hypothetical protein